MATSELKEHKAWAYPPQINPSVAAMKRGPESLNKNDPMGEERMQTSQKLEILTRRFLNATMPQIVTTSSFVSLIWLSCYLFFVSILSFQAFLTIRDYYSHPVNVEVTIETTGMSLEFPAVTLCNNNIVRKNSIARIPKYKELASLSDFVYQEILPESNRDPGHLRSLGLHQCANPSSMWIPGSWVCNDRQDCPDSSDENSVLCSQNQPLNYSQNCLDEYEKCPGESTCAIFCDGVHDCVLVPGFDESMERECLPIHGTSYISAELTPKTLSSPNFPEEYVNNLDKTYVIEAPEDHVLVISFTEFFVEECYRSECPCDFLTIRDGDSDSDRFFTFNGNHKMCGSMCDFSDIISSSNQITLYFYSDYSVAYSGWSLNYWAVSANESSSVESQQITNGVSCGNYLSHRDYDYDYGSSDYRQQDDSTPTPDLDSVGGGLGNEDETGPEPPESADSQVIETGFIAEYDWYSVYQNSEMPDFSDFKKYIKFEQDELIGNGHQKEDSIIQCVFDGAVCNASVFRTFQHVSFGNCFSFNYIIDTEGDGGGLDDVIVTSKVGSDNGLSLSLFLENEEYIGVTGHKSGLRLVLHNADEYPPLLTKSIQINSGTATSITMRQETVLRETDPFSDCADEWPVSLELNENFQKYRYTVEFCQYLCKQRALAEFCGCTDTFDWNFSKNESIRHRAKQDCDVWNTTDHECLISVYNDYAEGRRSCDCPNSCSNKIFKTSISSSSWPSAAYTAHFISLMKHSNSSKVRKFINTVLTDAYNDEWAKALLKENIQENFARVEISFETMVYQKIKESPKYNLSTLFGTIGGNLGLWLGWSILSVLEIVQWMGMTVVLFVVDRKKRAQVASNSEKQDSGPYL